MPFADPIRRALATLLACLAFSGIAHGAGLRAGTALIDVSPTHFPIMLNGGFFPQIATNLHDPLRARCLVLEQGATRIGFCVLDTCLFSREFADEVKQGMSAASGIPVDHLIFSATHTHTAPSIMECHGTPVEEEYQRSLPARLAEGMRLAVSRLQPAKIGWGVTQAWDRTFCRRWVRRPDRIGEDPFGEKTVRVNMNPGYESPDVISPAGPKEADLSLLAVETREGRPLAVLANFGNHYFGRDGLGASADYFAVFATRVGELLGENKDPGFLGIMSQGTSGDQNRFNFASPADKTTTIESYADDLARKAVEVYRRLQWHEEVPLAMRDVDLPLKTRGPSPKRLGWARGLVAAMAGRLPKTLPEIYAREQIWLHEHPRRLAKLQAIRIGDLGIVTASAEVYAITGLKLKQASPLQPTFWITLANGEEGYIPTPEQHRMGGYTTWPTRTAALEEEAEPMILGRLLEMLEEVAGRRRRPPSEESGAYAAQVMKSHPMAYWRMNEALPAELHDSTGHGWSAQAGPGVLFHLPGAEAVVGINNLQPAQPNAFSGTQINRSIHLAGGSVRASLPRLPEQYSIEFWFWNGLSNQLRGVTGLLAGRGSRDAIGIGGTNQVPGVLWFSGLGDPSHAISGRTLIPWRSWHHVVLSRAGSHVRVHLDGDRVPEIDADVAISGGRESEPAVVWLGGDGQGRDGLEGRLDEVAVYDRVLRQEEIAEHFVSAGVSRQ